MSESRPRRHVDIRIATYNIHRCRGMDRRTMPARIAEVIRDMGADVVALQEVIGAGPTGLGQAEEIGAALGMGWVMASTRELRRHQFGNVVLSRFPIRDHARLDLSWKTCEPRCSQRVARIAQGASREGMGRRVMRGEAAMLISRSFGRLTRLPGY